MNILTRLFRRLKPPPMFNWTEDALKRQYETAKANGWLPFFIRAAQVYKLNPEQLIAVASRESGSYWATHPTGDIVGDHGDALGPFQVNVRFHPDQENYTTVEGNIMRGAKILASYRAAIAKKVADYAHTLEPEVIDEMLFASYNRGVAGMWKGWLESDDPSFITAGNDYGKDCLARAEIFKRILESDSVGA